MGVVDGVTRSKAKIRAARDSALVDLSACNAEIGSLRWRVDSLAAVVKTYRELARFRDDEINVLMFRAICGWVCTAVLVFLAIVAAVFGHIR